MVEKEIQIPSPWCGHICKNALKDVCMEDCAVKRDCHWFELKPDVTVEVMADYPIKDIKDMTKEEKFVSVAVYVAKITETLKGGGNGNDPNYP